MAPFGPASDDPNEHSGKHPIAKRPKKHVVFCDASPPSRRWRTKRSVRTCSVARDVTENNRPTDVPVELTADATLIQCTKCSE